MNSLNSVLQLKNTESEIRNNLVDLLTEVKGLVTISGPFRRFSTRMWQKAHRNTVRHAIVCDVYFWFSKVTFSRTDVSLFKQVNE